MSNIELFNNLLNTTSYDRYNNWIDFRMQIDAFLMHEINRLSTKEITVVVGAGRCEDFSLKLLVDNFKTVVLSDVDVKSIFNSVAYQNLSKSEKEKVKVLKVEYTGVENNGFFDSLEERLKGLVDFDSIDKLFSSGFKGVYNYKFHKDLTDKVDLVYVSPIYTQLIYQQVMMICSKLRGNGYPENLLKYIEHKTSEKLVEVFEAFNSNLKRIVKGRLIVVSDIFQDYSNSSFMMNAKKDFSKKRMDQIYNEYFDTFGFGMGDLGLYLLNESMSLLKEEWLLWPFEERSEMIVKLSIYKK